MPTPDSRRGSPSAAKERAYPRELVERVANVLMWGVTTGLNHPDASFEKFAEQVLKVIDHEGYLLAADRLPDPACTGSNECPVAVHLHGCFSDYGNCDNPSDHSAPVSAAVSPTEPPERVRVPEGAGRPAAPGEGPPADPSVSPAATPDAARNLSEAQRLDNETGGFLGGSPADTIRAAEEWIGDFRDTWDWPIEYATRDVDRAAAWTTLDQAATLAEEMAALASVLLAVGERDKAEIERLREAIRAPGVANVNALAPRDHVAPEPVSLPPPCPPKMTATMERDRRQIAQLTEALEREKTKRAIAFSFIPEECHEDYADRLAIVDDAVLAGEEDDPE